MADHHNAPQKAGAPWLGYVVGLILLVVGATIGQAWEVPVPGIPLNLGKTVAMIGILLILFPIVRMFYTEPLAQAIQERNTHLENTFSEAENLRTEMTQLRTDYERRLNETEARARDQIQSQIKEAQNLRQQLMSEATERADEMVRRAQEEIAAERDKLIADLRTHVGDLTLAAAERVIGENMTTERNRKLVEDFIEKVEVAR